MTTDSAASTRKSLSIAAVIMMSSVLLSRIIGLLREMVLANSGGTTVEMDAYVTSFLIPELLNHFLASGFLSITFIPIFQRYLTSSRSDEGWKSFSNLLTIGSILFLIFIPATMILTPVLLLPMGPHIKSPETYHLTIRLTRIILPAQIFFYWGAFFNAVQMAQRRFFLPALTPLIYNAGIIVGGIILGPSLHIEGFAWGVLAGSFFGNVVLPLPGAIAVGMRYAPQFDLRHPDVKTYVIKTLPLILGFSMSSSTELFFRFFGSYLPEGGTSSVNYALRTMMIVVGVFGQASGVAFFPFLSQLAAEKKFDEMTRLLNNLLHKIAIFLLPVSAALYSVARPIIELLYERGKFNHESTIETASVFCVYIFGSFTFSAAVIIARSFYALQNMITPLITSTLISIGSIPLYLLFSHVAGARGMAIASVTGMLFQCIILYVIWNRKFGSIKNITGEILFFTKVLLISLGAAAAGRVFDHTVLLQLQLFSSIHRLQLIFRIVAGTLPVFIVAFVTYELTGLHRMRDTIRLFFKK